MSPDTPLHEHSVHLWVIRPETLTDPGMLASFRELMSPDERRIHGRFRLDEDRHRHLITRALVRSVLSRYLGIPAATLTFRRDPLGRPELAPEHARLPIRFNLTHTRGLIACAITLIRDVGVDAEALSRWAEVAEIAEHVFSPGETAYLRTLGEPRRQLSLVHLWTLKEAYLKARGLGLSLPLRQFTLVPDPAGISLRCEPAFDPAPQHWQFLLHQPTSEHILSLAVHQPSGTETLLKTGYWRPAS